MKRRLLIAGAVLGALAILALVGALSFPGIGRWVVRRKVIPRVEKLLGRNVRVAAIHVGWKQVVLEGVEVVGPRDGARPLVTAARVVVDYDFWSALDGEPELGAMTVERPSASLVRAPDGTDNWSDVLDRLRRRGDGEGERRGPRLRPTLVKFEHGGLTLDDRAAGVTVAIEEIAGEAVPRGSVRVVFSRVAATSELGPAATADRIVYDADLRDLRGSSRVDVAGGTASIWPKLSLTGIAGTIAADGDGGALAIAVRGGYGGVEGATLWHAEGRVDPGRREGDLELRADRFTLEKVAPILAGTPVMSPEKTSLDASLDLKLQDGVLTFTGGVNLAGLTVFDPWLAEQPVRELGFKGVIHGSYTTRGRLLTLDVLEVEFRGVLMRLDGYAALPGGVEGDGATRRERPRLRARFVVPPVPCQTALNALPADLTPNMQGFKLKGTFSTDLMVDIDWANLDAVELGGSVGIWACKVLKAPEAIDAKRLEGEFEHVVEIEQDKWVSFVVGPSNPDYVPLYDVSPYVIKSFLTTEDSGFYRHKGFITREFRSALVKNLKEGYFKYGASSITMQFVKNVLLYRQKTLARKLQELYLTWYVEQTLTKDRIMEIYVNVIEFGPGIYGIGPAARHYFGKHPRELNPIEAAFFSSILPSPKRRYMQYCEGKLSRWGDGKVQRILKVMHERGHLDADEYARAIETPLVFARPEAMSEAQCKLMVKRLIERQRPTLPPRQVVAN